MVAGSATTRGVATLLTCATSAAGAIPLLAELEGVVTNVKEPATKPCGVEERADDRQSNHGKHRPEKWSRNPWDLVHIPNNAQGW